MKLKARKRQLRMYSGLLAILFIFLGVAITIIVSKSKDGNNIAKNGIAQTEDISLSKTMISEPKIIVLDPGHGGEDPGCSVGDIYEDDINLSIAKKLKPMLENAGYVVYMTREDDAFVGVRDRANYANEIGADLYISIHQNSESAIVTTNGTVNGVEVWYNSEKDESSMHLAQVIQDTLVNTTEAKNLGIKIENEFVVIRDTTMPSCLIECGYISNKAERKRLTTEDYQDKLAKGILEGIKNYFMN